MSEAAIQRLILQMIKAEFPGAFVRKLADRNIVGLPDLLVVLDGKAAFLEIKAPGGRVTPMQKYTLLEIQRAGGTAQVVRSVKEAKEVLKNVARTPAC